uniref:Uncharacterized protein n=1 Tax=Trichobilharzia regenti TaxID=157069 RepID=A0AA85JSP0_TRIRE|nr:unnamed protein product [Trichobilharzia regenti]
MTNQKTTVKKPTENTGMLESAKKETSQYARKYTIIINWREKYKDDSKRHTAGRERRKGKHDREDNHEKKKNSTERNTQNKESQQEKQTETNKKYEEKKDDEKTRKEGEEVDETQETRNETHTEEEAVTIHQSELEGDDRSTSPFESTGHRDTRHNQTVELKDTSPEIDPLEPFTIPPLTVNVLRPESVPDENQPVDTGDRTDEPTDQSVNEEDKAEAEASVSQPPDHHQRTPDGENTDENVEGVTEHQIVDILTELTDSELSEGGESDTQVVHTVNIIGDGDDGSVSETEKAVAIDKEICSDENQPVDTGDRTDEPTDQSVNEEDKAEAEASVSQPPDHHQRTPDGGNTDENVEGVTEHQIVDTLTELTDSELSEGGESDTQVVHTVNIIGDGDDGSVSETEKAVAIDKEYVEEKDDEKTRKEGEEVDETQETRNETHTEEEAVTIHQSELEGDDRSTSPFESTGHRDTRHNQTVELKDTSPEIDPLEPFTIPRLTVNVLRPESVPDENQPVDTGDRTDEPTDQSVNEEDKAEAEASVSQPPDHHQRTPDGGTQMRMWRDELSEGGESDTQVVHTVNIIGDGDDGSVSETEKAVAIDKEYVEEKDDEKTRKEGEEVDETQETRNETHTEEEAVTIHQSELEGDDRSTSPFESTGHRDTRHNQTVELKDTSPEIDPLEPFTIPRLTVNVLRPESVPDENQPVDTGDRTDEPTDQSVNEEDKAEAEASVSQPPDHHQRTPDGENTDENVEGVTEHQIVDTLTELTDSELSEGGESDTQVVHTVNIIGDGDDGSVSETEKAVAIDKEYVEEKDDEKTRKEGEEVDETQETRNETHTEEEAVTIHQSELEGDDRSTSPFESTGHRDTRHNQTVELKDTSPEIDSLEPFTIPRLTVNVLRPESVPDENQPVDTGDRTDEPTDQSVNEEDKAEAEASVSQPPDHHQRTPDGENTDENVEGVTEHQIVDTLTELTDSELSEGGESDTQVVHTVNIIGDGDDGSVSETEKAVAIDKEYVEEKDDEKTRKEGEEVDETQETRNETHTEEEAVTIHQSELEGDDRSTSPFESTGHRDTRHNQTVELKDTSPEIDSLEPFTIPRLTVNVLRPESVPDENQPVDTGDRTDEPTDQSVNEEDKAEAEASVSQPPDHHQRTPDGGTQMRMWRDELSEGGESDTQVVHTVNIIGDGDDGSVSETEKAVAIDKEYVEEKDDEKTRKEGEEVDETQETRNETHTEEEAVTIHQSELEGDDRSTSPFESTGHRDTRHNQTVELKDTSPEIDPLEPFTIPRLTVNVLRPESVPDENQPVDTGDRTDEPTDQSVNEEDKAEAEASVSQPPDHHQRTPDGENTDENVEGVTEHQIVDTLTELTDSELSEGGESDTQVVHTVNIIGDGDDGSVSETEKAVAIDKEYVEEKDDEKTRKEGEEVDETQETRNETHTEEEAVTIHQSELEGDDRSTSPFESMGHRDTRHNQTVELKDTSPEIDSLEPFTIPPLTVNVLRPESVPDENQPVDTGDRTDEPTDQSVNEEDKAEAEASVSQPPDHHQRTPDGENTDENVEGVTEHQIVDILTELTDSELSEGGYYFDFHFKSPYHSFSNTYNSFSKVYSAFSQLMFTRIHNKFCIFVSLPASNTGLCNDCFKLPVSLTSKTVFSSLHSMISACNLNYSVFISMSSLDFLDISYSTLGSQRRFTSKSRKSRHIFHNAFK